MVSSNQKTCTFDNCDNQAYYGYKGQARLTCRKHKQDGMNLCKKLKICEFQDCTTTANYDFLGGKGARFCGLHKFPGMVNRGKKQVCKFEGCESVAQFNYANNRGKRYCAEHRKDGMVISSYKKCEYETCVQKNPKFNFKIGSSSVGRFCGAHKIEGMVNLSTVCQSSGCGKRARFSSEIWRAPQFCAEHKSKNMFNLKRPRCLQQGCVATSQYNSPGKKKPIFCKSHKVEGMVNILGRKCEVSDCTRTPIFALNWRANPRFCEVHKSTSMDETTSVCEFKDCRRKACYTKNDENVARYCRQHKTEQMILILQRRCSFTQCLEEACYGFQSEKVSRCLLHRITGMVINPLRIQKKSCRPTKAMKIELCSPVAFSLCTLPSNTTCLAAACEEKPVYGYSKKLKGTHCLLHKKPKMVDVTAVCRSIGCTRFPFYSDEGYLQAHFCAEHRSAGMVNIISVSCQQTDCTLVPLFNFAGFCAQWCVLHKLDGMIDVTTKAFRSTKPKEISSEYVNGYDFEAFDDLGWPGMSHAKQLPLIYNYCESGKCNQRAYFKYPFEFDARFCKSHKLLGMRKISTCICEIEGCNEIARFKDISDAQKRFCKFHKLPGMAGKMSKLCDFGTCSLFARYKYEDNKKKACKVHKEPGMVSLLLLRKYGTCDSGSCKKLARFNFKHSQPPVFCSGHSLPGMVQVLTFEQGPPNSCCATLDCTKKAVFFVKDNPNQKVCQAHHSSTNTYELLCWSDACEQPAIYTERGPGVNLYRRKACSEHMNKAFEMVPIRVFCEQEACGNSAHYNFKGNIIGKFCSEHKLDAMVDIRAAVYRCARGAQAGRCFRMPVFNLPGEIEGKFCALHKTSLMVDVVSNQCHASDCTRRPAFNFREAQLPVFCREHQAPGMIDHTVKICCVIECEKEGIFHRKDQAGRFCRFHANATEKFPKRHCEYEGCTQIPKYGYSGEKIRRRCAEHKEAGMILSSQKYCKFEGCCTRASYGLPGHKIEYCALHKKDKMEALGRTCAFPSCSKFPSYNFPGARTKRYCAKHKQDGMVEVSRLHLDCQHKDGCNKRGKFCFEEIPNHRFCYKHRTKEMVDLSSIFCQAKGCKEQACYGSREDGKKVVCFHHRQVGQVQILAKTNTCTEMKCRKRIAVIDKVSWEDNDKEPAETVRYCEEHLFRQTAFQTYNAANSSSPEEAKQDGVIIKAVCELLTCRKTATYGFTRRSVCSKHKMSGMVELF